MAAPRRNMPLLIGLLGSLSVHAWILLPLLFQAMQGPPGRTIALASFDPDDFQPPPDHEPPEPDAMQLGREEGAPSTLTWIGYEEYEEHLARLAEIEQAAFEDEPAGDDGQPQPTPVPEPAAVPGARQPENPAAPPTDAPPVATIDDPVPPASPLEAQPETGPDVQGAMLTAEAREELADVLAAVITPFGIALRPPAPAADEATSAAHLQEPGTARDQPSPQPETKEQAGAGDAPATDTQPQQPPGTPNQGDDADMESDASSVVDIPLDEIRVGKPLAAQGLELRPRRPRFTTLQRLTAAAGNPVVEIRFGRDGVPRRASILRSTGNSGIDAAIEASLYRWRASGKPLEAITGDETVDLQIRIILFGRRR